MNLILFGAPGAGKGTQAELLEKHFNLQHISTGDLLRQAMRKKTALGLKAAAYMNCGKLAPDQIVIGLIEEHLSSTKTGWLLDGFPRTLLQAQALEQLLKQKNQTLTRVVYLEAAKKILLERITGRRIAEQSGQVYHIKFHPPKKKDVCDITGEKLTHREDDKSSAVQVRLKAYQIQTAPLLNYYRKQNILTKVNGEGAKEEIFNRIQKILSNL